MTLPDYIASGADTWQSLAERVGIYKSALHMIGSGKRDCANTLGSAIERETGGKVTQGEIAAARRAYLANNNAAA